MKKPRSEVRERFEAFRQALEPQLEAADEQLRKTEMKVVVFGPGKSSSYYEKRQQIRAALNKVPGVTAFFPEEAKFAEPYVQRYGIPRGDALTLELLQARDADVIVALEPGPGVDQEVAIFSTRAHFAVKLLNLLPEHYKKTPRSFAGQLRAGIEKHYYTKAELKNCTLATVVVIGHIAARQVQKMLL